MSRLIYVLSLSVLFFSCTKKAEKPLTSPNKHISTVKFQLPTVPSSITDAGEKNKYLAYHYFDRLNVSDTLFIHNTDVGEQAISDFIYFIQNAPQEVEDSAFYYVVKKVSSEPTMLLYFWNTFNHYLKDPNSPMRNENLFIAACKAILAQPKMDEVISSKAEFDLRMALKNRIGEKAANFTYTMESGAQKQLYGLKTKYILVMFYDPDCHTCQSTENFIDKTELFNSLIGKSLLTILAFYPENGKDIWLQHMADASPLWVKGYDAKGIVKSKQIYDIAAYPTFYLLNADKKVLLKDAPINVVAQYLQENS